MRWLSVLALVSSLGCGPSFQERSVQGLHAADSIDFWSLPLPSDLRRKADGSYGLLDWPVDQPSELVALWLAAADAELRHGWGLNSGIFVPLSGAIDPTSLPGNAAATLRSDATVYLVDLSPESPDFGRRLALEVEFDADGDNYGPAHLITAVPVPGHTRRPSTRYALVVTDGVLDLEGKPIGPSRSLYHGLFNPDAADPALADHLTGIADLLEAQGQDPRKIASLAVFTTMDNSADIRKLAAWAREQPLPELSSDWQVAEDYEGFQVLTNAVALPVVQNGERPYANVGEGLIQWGDDDQPLVTEYQDVRLALAIPKMAAPAAGFPLTLYMHGSGGEWYQGIERGPKDEVENPSPPAPGLGPAYWLAQRGVATLGFDFSLHGNRHSPPDTSGLVLYNITGNPQTTLHNFKVAVMELVFLARVAGSIKVPAALAVGLDAGGAEDGLITINGERLTAMGQSMGSTLGAVWSTVDTQVKGLVFAGAGGLLTEIGTKATEPFEVRPMLELLSSPGREFTHSRPLLNAFQNLWDYVDPVAHMRHVVSEPHEGIAPKHVLMPSGVRDGYFHPRAETGFAVAGMLPLAGPSVEPILPDSQSLRGIAPVSYPVRASLNGRAAAVSHWNAPFDLGHYVVFNKETARYQYTCFLASVGKESGAAIPEPKSWNAPCP
ncbi:MAG: hypothetical protein VX405_10960 [Myxococcota bacterium]|nr:hypothetical protein [Myxococcota bacterium]